MSLFNSKKIIKILTVLVFVFFIAFIIAACGHEHNPTYVEAKNATCEENGNCEYWYCKGCNKYFTDDACKHEIPAEDTVIKALGHSWDKESIVWNWNADFSAATATFTCLRNAEHSESLNAQITSSVTSPATCTDAGTKTYTATVSFNNEEVSDTKTETLPVLMHDWDMDNIIWNWSTDHSSATATFTCLHDAEHTETITAQITSSVTSPATCTETGTKTYTATVSFNNEKVSDTTTKTLPTLGHIWDTDNMQWVWANDHTTATATLICENDPSHKQVATAQGSSITSQITTPATCTEAGTRTYTAEVKFFNRTYTGQSTETILTLGHDWDMQNIVWNWTDYSSATATLCCKNDSSHTQTAIAQGSSITSEITTPATCTDTGTKTYTAEVTLNGQKVFGTKTETLPALGHNWDTENVVWDWETDFSAATATFTCLKNAEHPETINAQITTTVTNPATCTEGGLKTYTAKVTFNGETFTDTRTETLPATGHSFSDEWSGDETYHWHACTNENCTEIQDKAEHTFENGYCTVCHAQKVSTGLQYTLSYDKTFYYVTGIGTCTDTEIVIPSEYQGIPVQAISVLQPSTVSYTSIHIPSSIKNIYKTVNFSNSLTEVHITDIGAWCGILFADYSANPLSIAKDLYLNGKLVTALEIPDDVTEIGQYAFYNCTSLQSVTLGNNLASIGQSAFYNCTSLQSVTFGNNLTSIGQYAFYNCTALTGVYITDVSAWCGILFADYSANPLYFAKSLYLNNVLVTDLVIPDNVKSVGQYAFSNYTALQSVSVGNGVESFGTSAFADCTALKGVYIKDLAAWCNITVDYRSSTPISEAQNLYLNGTLVKSLEIPDNVTNIGKFAFYNCNITSVTIGSGVKNIGDNAFEKCGNLTKVIISEGVTSIGNNVFAKCSKLSEITIPKSVTSIGDEILAECYALKSIYFNGTMAEWNAIEKGAKWNYNLAVANYTIRCSDGNIAKDS